MPYNGYNRSHCRGCGRPRRQGETFSARGKCDDCGEGRMIANARELRAHNGPAFEHWRLRTLAAFGVAVPHDHDDTEAA